MSDLKSKLAASVRQVKYQNSTNNPDASAAKPAASNPPTTPVAKARAPEAKPRSATAKKKSSDVNNRSASNGPAVWPD